MHVRVYATLRPLVGGRSVDLDDGCATAGDVIKELIGRFPALSDRLLDPHGAVRPYVAIMVDGRDIRHVGGLHTAVGPDSELDIFPPVAGGQR